MMVIARTSARNNRLPLTASRIGGLLALLILWLTGTASAQTYYEDTTALHSLYPALYPPDDAQPPFSDGQDSTNVSPANSESDEPWPTSGFEERQFQDRPFSKLVFGSSADSPLDCPPFLCSPYHADHEDPYWIEVSGGAWLAALEGHLHTPRGGQPGSTSPNRPRVDEIDLNRATWLPWVDVRLGLGLLHELHLNGTFIQRSGQDILTDTLISQAQTFPAGSHVASTFGLNTYRAGYRPLALQAEAAGWRMTPEAGIGFSQFKYLLSSPTATGPVDRQYGIGFPYLGVLFEKPITDQLGFEADIAGIGGINGVSFLDSDFRLTIGLATKGRSRTEAIIGWRGLWLRRHDHQSGEQNDPNMRFGLFSDRPWSGLSLGLRVPY